MNWEKDISYQLKDPRIVMELSRNVQSENTQNLG